MSAYPDEATLVLQHVAPFPALKAVRRTQRDVMAKAAEAAGRGRPAGPKHPPSKGAQTKPACAPIINWPSDKCVIACQRRARQISLEGPTPPGCSDDWYWHDNCHTQRRRQATLESGKPAVQCKPKHQVKCQLALVGEPCDCLDPQEPSVFPMDA